MKIIKDKNAIKQLSQERFERRNKRIRIKKEDKKRAAKLNITYRKFRERSRNYHLKRKLEIYTTIIPPSNFSIIDNPIETLAFFERLDEEFSKYNPISVNMKGISNITVDALVYYIAILQKARARFKEIFLKGSFPDNPKVQDLMKKSGFLNYFETDHDNIKSSSDMIQIKSGHNADNQIVKDVCIFVQDKFNISRVKTRRLYDIIFEMMLNTKQHAYSSNGNQYDKWLLFSHYYPEKNSIDFIFMDTGYGIPQTVRRNKLEMVKKWFSVLGLTTFTEHQLVQSALQGAFRTQTNEGYRGKGLPRIYNTFNDGYIQKLNILSNKACIEKDSAYDLDREMNGTLFYWTITKEILNG